MKILVRILAALALTTALATPAMAQTRDGGLLLSAGVSFLRIEGENGTGFKVDIAKSISALTNGTVDVVGEVGFHRFDFFDVNILNFGGGARVTMTPADSPVDIFGQFIFGIGRASEDGESATDPYAAPGGGVRFKVNDSVSVFGQYDFVLLLGDSIGDNGQRFTFGVVVRVGG